MPRRDGTGPIGFGQRTGKGLGFCTDSNAVNHKSVFGMRLGCGFARGFGFAGGFGRNFALNKNFGRANKELLQRQKDSLQNQIEAVDKQFENL